MPKSIEERMEDTLQDKANQRFTGQMEPANWAEGFTNSCNKLSEQGSVIHESYIDALKERFEKRKVLDMFKSLVTQIPNDQELGAAVREWYYKTLCDE